ncbi:MAG: hypothetical protein AAF431_05610 [Pseudomonadota bacterium]
MKNRVLFLLGDCPGFYVPLMYALAEKLVQQDVEVLMASTTPYYEKYYEVDFSSLGKVFYLSEYLQEDFSDSQLANTKINYWWAYPTYVRDSYFVGKHRNDWDIYKKTVLFYNQIFAENSVDLIVAEPPSNSFLYIGYGQAKQHSINFLGFIAARIPRHVNLFTDAYGQHLLENNLAEVGEDSVVSGPPDYMLVEKPALLKKIGVKRLINMIRFGHLRSVETGVTPYHQLKAYYLKYIWRKLRYFHSQLSGVFSHQQLDNNKINILYPLHLRPEASTSVLAKFYENDLEIIKNIAFSLPANSRLIVKEHFPAVGIRNTKFYRQVSSFPNTTVLRPDYDLTANLSKFDAVIVLSSTVGFEAIQQGIPVFLLGRTFYSDYPGVVNVDSYSQLEKCLRELDKAPQIPNQEVMKLYRRYCFKGQFNYMSQSVMREENVEHLLKPVLQNLAAVKR